MRMREFWKQDHLCDVTLKTDDGTEHRCHRLVLSAASTALQNLLGGRFQEGQQLQHGEPVAICASSCVIGAMLDYIYGGEPEVADKDLMELLRLAGAYELPELVHAIEEELQSSLDSSTALKLLPQIRDLNLHALMRASEERVAADFEKCAEETDFLALSSAQLSRILQREDLKVSREEVVLQALFKWTSASHDDRKMYLAVLLPLVDLPSVAEDNLKRLCLYAQSMGSGGSDVQFAVQTALHRQKKRKKDGSSKMYHPKRLCLEHWSPSLGGHGSNSQRILPIEGCELALLDGAFYVSQTDLRRVLCIKPGHDQRIVAGDGAPVNGFNDLSDDFLIAISHTGNLFVADVEAERIVKFSQGVGVVLHENFECIMGLACSPNGVLYILDHGGTRVQRLEGSMLEPVWSWDYDEFVGHDMFVTRDEVLYIGGHINDAQLRVIRFPPGSSKSTIAADFTEVNLKVDDCFLSLCGTDDESMFISLHDVDVYVVSPGARTGQKLGLHLAPNLSIDSVAVQGRSLYALVSDLDDLDGTERGGIYKFPLPPTLKLGLA
ncbi:Kelch-like ECH-associated protein 1B [Durusdinium trenchii]|uniref:Kelch-like ECH-associated protein 1B n=1 Tax=Durusdinium trenchii TaxID=1381693 RepID=A0ABP0PVG2_9DINO